MINDCTVLTERGNVVDPKDLHGLTPEEAAEALVVHATEQQKEHLLQRLRGDKKFVFQCSWSIRDH
jgi:hypothetical protein